MAKLSQVIAVEKSVKGRVIGEIDQIDKAIQRAGLFDGFIKQYKRKAEDDEDLPPQKQKVQVVAGRAIEDVKLRLAELFDVTAQKDYANCVAKADVEVEGKVLLSDAPATFLLFLEKQLVDLRTLVGRLPILDPADDWSLDSSTGLYRTQPTQTTRTKKVQKPLVLYPHSDKHPAQTQLITEDVAVGTWEQTKFSGAVPELRRRALLARVDKLLQAVKFAREKANLTEAPRVEVGANILNWIFQD